MTTFILNNELVETDLPSGMVMADYIRYHHSLTGTKLGCREGDCGACTVLVGEIDNGKLVYKSMTSCLMPLGNGQGKHIVTVEGVNIEGLNVAQQAMVDEGGTQCGICTPGFIVSLCGFVLSDRAKTYDNGVNAVAGNICRCTGYKSIQRAIGRIVEQLQTIDENNKIEQLVQKEFLPKYFLSVQGWLEKLEKKVALTSVEAEEGVFVGGGTDLYVQRPAKMRKSTVAHMLNRNDLKGIWVDCEVCKIGASATAEEMKNSPVFAQLLGEDQEPFFDLISSVQIRNMGSVAGNLVNASPIGDLSIIYLALGAEIKLNHQGAIRQLALPDFYLGYKQLDKKEGEYIQELSFLMPKNRFLFNFEKVCKRIYLDIASVNTAIALELDDNERITRAALSAGGVAAVPLYLKAASEFLLGKKVTVELLKESLEIAIGEVAPISDVRGTAAYKKLLLRQLITAHYMKFFPSFSF